MVFNSFNLKLVLRVIAVFLLSFFLVYFIVVKHMFLSASFFGFLLIAQVAELIYFTGRVNREIQKFVDALHYNELTTSFPKHNLGNHFGKLFKAFNNFLEHQKNIKAEQEAHLHFINSVLNQISTGIIAANHNDEILLMNKAACDGLNIPKVHNLQKIKHKIPELFLLQEPFSNKMKKLVNIDLGTEFKTLTVYLTKVKIKGNEYKIVTFQDIKGELGEKELEAWNKLISILTHEIMNSVTPILSLSGSIKDLLNQENIATQPQIIEDTKNALNTIHRRSEGLLKFVHDYRRMAKIPIPEIKEVNVKDLIERTVNLLYTDFKELNISISVHIPNKRLFLHIDEQLMEQVIINLLLNAKDALQNSMPKNIEISAYQEEQSKIIEIRDNGSGIPDEIREKIFVPFYSTKTNGSGIGLSLSRQIINLMGGSIKFSTTNGKGTTFYLVF